MSIHSQFLDATKARRSVVGLLVRLRWKQHPPVGLKGADPNLLVYHVVQLTIDEETSNVVRLHRVQSKNQVQ